MFGWLIRKKRFTLRMTLAGFQRWTWLVKQSGLPFEQERKMMHRVLGFYMLAADWESYPLFVEDAAVDFVRCNLKDYTAKPEDSWVYDLPWEVSRHEWKAWRSLLAQSGDGDMSVMVDRALQLYERFVNGRLPTLFTVDRLGDFVEIEYTTA